MKDWLNQLARGVTDKADDKKYYHGSNMCSEMSL